jgi:acetyltransferase-like isoleucine patch superfamily enzyme
MIFSPKHLLGILLAKIVDWRSRYQPYGRTGVVLGRDVEGVKNVRFGGENSIGRGVVFLGEISVGYGTTISANSYLIGPVEIGNYCQIGANVGVIGRDHPTSYLSTYINRKLFNGRMRIHEKLQEVKIGHDVWIGQGCVILKGVSIGNGTVIGAGSIVTKSFPAFSVIVGNPARIIKKRFPDDIAHLIASLAWWSKPVEELESIETIFNIDYELYPDNFKNTLVDIIATQQKEL